MQVNLIFLIDKFNIWQYKHTIHLVHLVIEDLRSLRKNNNKYSMRSKRCKNACEILRLKAGISKWLGGVRLPKLVVVEVGVAGW